MLDKIMAEQKIINAKEYCIECNLKEIATIMVDCQHLLEIKDKAKLKERTEQAKELCGKILVTLEQWTDNCCRD